MRDIYNKSVLCILQFHAAAFAACLAASQGSDARGESFAFDMPELPSASHSTPLLSDALAKAQQLQLRRQYPQDRLQAMTLLSIIAAEGQHESKPFVEESWIQLTRSAKSTQATARR